MGLFIMLLDDLIYCIQHMIMPLYHLSGESTAEILEWKQVLRPFHVEMGVGVGGEGVLLILSGLLWGWH